MMETAMDEPLCYDSMELSVPQDHKSFEPQVVKKRQKDISDIDQKIIK